MTNIPWHKYCPECGTEIQAVERNYDNIGWYNKFLLRWTGFTARRFNPNSGREQILYEYTCPNARWYNSKHLELLTVSYIKDI